MSLTPEDKSERDFFLDKYARLGSAASREVEREVLGHTVGLNGFTTVEQAEALVEHLSLTTNGRLLDLGCGRGWPGSAIAEASGCDLYASDIPLNALSEARRNFGPRTPSGRREVVAADARHLPFADGSFDGISHADVFC